MTQKLKIYVVTQENQETIDSLTLSMKNWAVLGQLLFSQETYQLKINDELLDLTYSELNQLIATKEWQLESRIILTYKEQNEELSFVYTAKKSCQRLILSEVGYSEQRVIIEDYIDKLMETIGIYAYIRPMVEFLSHNLQNISDRKIENLSFPIKLPLMYDDDQQEIVDISQLSGYDYHFKGLCFTSCWQMWFTESYYKIIPKNVFLDLQQVTSIRELANNVLKVILYSDPALWNHPQNIKFQFLFRDQLGFDHLEWRNGVGVMREPYAEFTTFNNGTQMIQFQNNSLQPTTKFESQHFTTRLFNGPNFDYIEGRRYGTLNEKAYFPWRDEKNKQLIVYWTINPMYMLDNGLKAFEFYIRQYIKVFNEKMTQSEYQGVLRFYLPKESLKTVPVEKLTFRNKMKKNPERKARSQDLSFLIPLSNRGLVVEFLDVEQLTKQLPNTQVTEKESTLLTKLKVKIQELKRS